MQDSLCSEAGTSCCNRTFTCKMCAACPGALANISVAFSLFINKQIEIQEQIETCLWKLDALISVAVIAKGFYEAPENILCNYFFVAGDVIQEATKANQLSLKELLSVLDKINY
jgi:hypothetical protein